MNCNGYECVYNTELTVDDLRKNGADLSLSDAQRIVNIADGIKNVIDIQNGIIQISLFLMNFIVALFIIIGLYKYQKSTGFKQLSINLIVLVIVCLQMLLVTTINIFNYPPIQCSIYINYYYSTYAITWFDLLQTICCSILWYIWCSHSFKNKGKYCKYLAVCFILSIPLIGFAIMYYDHRDYEDMRLSASIFFYIFFQLLIPIIWCLIITRENIHSSCVEKCGRLYKNKCCESRLTWIILFIIGCILQLMTIDFASYRGDDECILYGGALLWWNPIYVLINVFLLFSDARYAVVLYYIKLSLQSYLGHLGSVMVSVGLL